MKKLFVLALSVLCLSANLVVAQSPAQIEESKKRCADIEESIKKRPKPAAVKEVDDYVDAAFSAAEPTLKTSQRLNRLALGEEKMPVAAEVIALGVTITDQGEKIAEIPKKVKPAMDAAKGQKNPAKAASASKAVSAATDLTSKLAEESAYQLMVIAELGKKAAK